MRVYNTKLIRDFIEDNKNEIHSVICGMREDWSWTADKVFYDGEYIEDLSGEEVNIAGITGSTWATPIMEIEYKNGNIQTFDCYKDDEVAEDISRIMGQRKFAFLTGGMDYNLNL